MRIEIMIVAAVAGVAVNAMALDNVEVTSVSARQRYPWNGKVDIDFKLDSKATEPYQMQVEVYDNVGKTNLPVKSVCTENVSVEENPCMARTDTTRIVWDAAKDLPNGFKCTNVLVTCRDARLIPVDKLYCVINLTDGSKEYLNGIPAGGWTDEHKTTKMVFRRIEAGTFMMGSPADEVGRQSNETQHKVTITHSYYISVFELTEAQYGVIVNASSLSKMPKLLRWGDVRGEDFYNNDSPGYYGSGFHQTEFCWPIYNSVSETSLIGRLRLLTGIVNLDLPTEAQWEMACRAGSVLAVNSGFGCDEDNFKTVCRYGGNSDDGKGDTSCTTRTIVGSYMPNSFGLYDMHGNAREWCLDVWKEDLGSDETMDPIGNEIPQYIDTSYYYTTDVGAKKYAKASLRMVKGGCYYDFYWYESDTHKVRADEKDKLVSFADCRSASRTFGYSAVINECYSYVYTREGVRLVFPSE